VDVGIVTWNTAELTTEVLTKLRDQDHGCRLRLLVHDNGSSDGTATTLSRLVPEAEVESSTQNLGFAAGVNRLLSRSNAPWFLTLNSDAWPEPGAIARLVDAAERDPHAAAVAPLLLRPDGRIEHSTHPFPSLGTALIDATQGRRWLPRRLLERRLLEGAWRQDRSRTVDWAVGAALLFRRSAVEQIGPLDERFFMYVEDLEWCWRARQLGWKVLFEPGAVVRHIGDVSGSRRWRGRRASLEAANLRVFLGEALGPRRAALYRTLEAAAIAEELLVARLRGEDDLAGHWRQELKVWLRFEPPPAVRPPEEEPDGPVRAGGNGEGTAPRVAVVVPTRNRAGSLVRLVAALEAQTIGREAFEVVIVDDGSTDDTPTALAQLAAHSSLSMRMERNPERLGPAMARNRGWRSTDAPVIAFTDDDCVPDPDWLLAGVKALDGRPRIVVGRTQPPDDQRSFSGEPYSLTLAVDSARFLETCNVFYRRRDIEAVGGFDERFRRPSGEDTHLGIRIIEQGAETVFEDKAIVYHDVRHGSFRSAFRETLRWTDLPLVLAGRPWARRGRTHRLLFWKPTHPSAILAAVGIGIGIRWRPALLLLLPWLRQRLITIPVCEQPGRRLRHLPGALALDLCEVAVMARGSIRHRTPLL
jgi:GT2 family glycosyltransferase